MNEFNFELLYWFCALLGMGLFLIQATLYLVGLEDEELISHHVSDVGKFKWLSRHALTGFLMIFGLSGLTCQIEWGWSPLMTFCLAFLAGLFAMILSGLLLHGFKKLQSTGAVFHLDAVIGLNGMVYQRIPPNGIGKITVTLDHLSREIDACALHGKSIPSFTPVKVINKANDQTVVVDVIEELT